MIKYSVLSKTVSHALRHEPWLYELEMDNQGWVNIDLLLFSLRPLYSDWNELNESDLVEMLRQSDKKRFSIEKGKIKALYGHSLPGRLMQTPAVPPVELFHGTSRDSIVDIQRNGLLPMRRQYVHLAVDVDSAKQVGLRKSRDPVILTVFATKANEESIQFYKGNTHVWLVHKIPPEFIDFPL